METKYIVVTGGVLSGLGKGVSTASLGHLLSYDCKVVPIKCDGYLNVDPGTMNPVEHGEVFVLDDGTEVDMDFGHYERFLSTSCSGPQNLTMGKVFDGLRKRERHGDFLGKTVQFIPHATDHILGWWRQVAREQKADICMIEIGGTLGDIENELYLEAARQLRLQLGPKQVCFIHLTYVPVPGGVNEQKSKPTQQSVRQLMERGITPSAILCRCHELISDKVKQKISIFSNVPQSAVISAVDVDSVYKIPGFYYAQGLLDCVNEQLDLNVQPDLTQWDTLVNQLTKAEDSVRIAICGKYTALEDSYASVVEALNHGGAHNNVQVEVVWIDTESLEKGKASAAELLNNIDGVIVPGGFGSRGIEGKIKIIETCRKKGIPFLGLCYGLQLAVIEFMRNVAGFSSAHTTEIKPKTRTPVVDILPEKKKLKDMGGTLRLGAYPAVLQKDSLAFHLYGKKKVSERHRHRFEVNPKYHKTLTKNGMCLSGMSPDGRLAEFIELANHPFFIATQGHPELKSSLQNPAPLFVGLVAAAKQGENSYFY